MGEAGWDDVEETARAWGRVTAWLREHGPAAGPAPGQALSPQAVAAFEERTGVNLRPELRAWLLAGAPELRHTQDAGAQPVMNGAADVLPGGSRLIGLPDIERMYVHRLFVESCLPAGSPPDPIPMWRRTWVPIAATDEGCSGVFLDMTTGTVGSWTETDFPVTDDYPSLAALFHAAADRLEGTGCGLPERLHDRRPQTVAMHAWARAAGYFVNDHGRIPAHIREAYENRGTDMNDHDGRLLRGRVYGCDPDDPDPGRSRDAAMPS